MLDEKTYLVNKLTDEQIKKNREVDHYLELVPRLKKEVEQTRYAKAELGIGGDGLRRDLEV